jgi:uncharacterized membrane protein YgcG
MQAAMTHRFHTPTLLLLLTLSAPASWAQTAAESAAASPEPSRPLNLSLPRDAVWSSTVRSDPPAAERPQGDASALPDPGARANGGQGQRGRMPYGSGYEARQRDPSGGGSGQAGAGGGRGSGSGGGSGGGRGMGRGR